MSLQTPLKSYGTVCCFGELLLRMSPVLHQQWIATQQMPVFIGGAELNVATALAQWNVPVKYCTALPDHYLAKEIVADITSKNINTNDIHFSGSRIGTYYLPQGADLKNAGVIYDRAYSSFWELQPGDINWDKVFQNVSWFHFSAISPALNEVVAKVCKQALEEAKSRAITVSVDLNYRAKLWQYGIAPSTIMQTLLPYCDVIMGNLWAVESLAGLVSPIKDSKGVSNERLKEAAIESMLMLQQQYPNATSLAYTFRLDDVYWTILKQAHGYYFSKEYSMRTVTDKVGSGDCFMGGIIYGLYHQHPAQQVIDFATAAAYGKMHETGDATRQTIAQVNQRLLQ